MSFNRSFTQSKLKDNYNIILSGLDADLDEIFELLVETSVKSRTFIRILG